ncbi:MAG: BTAD domain-containing putative transcriptional regulator, partial [Stackebrandtia sp.]
LYGHIARLRKLLGGAETITRTTTGGYRLELNPEDVDLHLGRQLAARARETSDNEAAGRLWRECCELWRDTPLSGIRGGWAESTRSALTAELLGLNAERFDAELSVGRHNAIIGELQDLLTRHPLNEALTNRLMTALYRSERAAEALERFRTLRERMVEELGSEPAKPLDDLQHQILNQDAELRQPTTVPATMFQLPPAPTSFHGRDRLVETVVAGSSRHRLIVIDGMAGVGKTALTLQVAHRLASRFPDGQLFCDLRGYAGRVPRLTAGEVLTRLLRGMGVAGREIPVDVEEMAALWRRTLAGRRVLIVLDNAATAEQVLPVLPADAEPLVLVSSRRRLPELDDAKPYTVDTLDEDSAVRLLQQAAGIDDPAAKREDIAKTVELCGRLPLAIRLAASRLKNRPQWNFEDLAKRLSRREHVLSEFNIGDRGVSAAFEGSYQDVSEEQRHLFRLLALFPGATFPAVVAARLLDIAEPEAEELLERLVDAHLLLTNRPGRYEFHDLLRRYAERVLDDEESEAARAAASQRVLLTYRDRTLAAGHRIAPTYLSLVEDPPGDMHGMSDLDTAIAWCQDELSTITAIVKTHADTYGDCMTRLARGLGPYFQYRARYSEAVSLARHCSNVARRLGDRDREAEWLNVEAVSRNFGDDSAAERLLDRALDLCRETGNRHREMAALNSLGNFHLRRNNIDSAAEGFRASVAIAEQIGPPRFEAMVRTNLACAWLDAERLEHLPDVTENLAKAQRYFADIEDEQQLTRSRYYEGIMLRLTGDLNGALQRQWQVTETCRARDEFQGEAWAHLEMARANTALERYR